MLKAISPHLDKVNVCFDSANGGVVMGGCLDALCGGWRRVTVMWRWDVCLWRGGGATGGDKIEEEEEESFVERNKEMLNSNDTLARSFNSFEAGYSLTVSHSVVVQNHFLKVLV